VNAVYVTIPASVWTYLEDRPNPRTHNGKYRPMQRYGQDFERKHGLASICRRYWRLRVPKRWVNRDPGQPCFTYLPMDLVAQLVRCLLDEFRFHEGAFISPFPRFETSETDYWTWEFEAIQRVQETLQMEAMGELWQLAVSARGVTLEGASAVTGLSLFADSQAPSHARKNHRACQGKSMPFFVGRECSEFRIRY